MENLDWAATYEAMGTDGWKFGYADTTFSQLVSTQTKDLAGYVTPVVDYRLGTIGTIEAVVPMKNLFPGLYEKSVGEWGCFVAEDGNVYYGSNYTDEAGRLQDKIWERVQQEHGDADGQDSFVSYYKLGGRKLIVTAYRENELGGTILGIKDITAEIQKVYDTRAWFIGGMIVLLIGVRLSSTGSYRICCVSSMRSCGACGLWKREICPFVLRLTARMRWENWDHS